MGLGGAGGAADPVRLRVELSAPVRQEGVMAVVDTGAERSCVTRGFVMELERKHGVRVEYERSRYRLRVAHGEAVEAAVVTMSLWVPTHTVGTRVLVRWPFAVLEDKERQRMLLGMDFLEALGFLYRGSGGVELRIPAQARLDGSDRDALAGSDDGDDIPDNIYSVSEVAASEDEVSRVSVCAALHSDQQDALRRILSDYSDVFSSVLHPEGAALPPFKIRLRDGAVPVRDKPRPLAANVLRAVDATFDQWKQQGLVEPTQGPWSSPVVVVFKKTGQYGGRRPGLQDDVTPSDLRVCSDLRKVNACTVPYPAPSVNMSAMLDAAAGHEFYAKLDLRSAYQQMRLDPASRPITGTVWPHGYVQHTRLPFGAMNGPALFQEAMSNAFQNLDGLQIFIDDMVIYAHTFEEFCERLKAVLQRCRDLRIRIKADKSLVGFAEIELLGHLVSGRGSGSRTPPCVRRVTIRRRRRSSSSSAQSVFLTGCATTSRDVPSSWRPSPVSPRPTSRGGLSKTQR